MSVQRLGRHWLALACLGAALIFPTTAQAHLGLSASSPAANDTVRTAISELRLTFTQDLALDLIRLRLSDASGREIALGGLRYVGSSKREVVVDAGPDLWDESYRLEWRVVGADGHPVTGTIAFTVLEVRPAPRPMDPRSDETAVSALQSDAAIPVEDASAGLRSPWAVAVRAVYFGGLLFVVGSLVFVAVVLPTASRRLGNGPGSFDAAGRDRLSRSVAWAAFTAALAFAVSVDLRVDLQADAVFQALGGSAADATRAFRRTLADTTWMRALNAQFTAALVTAVALALAARGRRWGWWIVALAMPVLVGAPALAGHAASTEPAAVSVALDALHVLAASAWMGALAVFALSAIPALRLDHVTPAGPRIAALAEAFSPLALASAATLALTGVAAAWMRVGADEAAWATAYGSTLQAKMGALLLVLAAGFYNWRRVRPRLGDDAGTRTLRLTSAVELIGGALVVIATAMLVATPLPG